MELFIDIVNNINNRIKNSEAQTVEEIFDCLKITCIDSKLDEHINVDRVEIYSEYYEVEADNYFRVAVQYYLEYLIDDEEYKHYEVIDCIFNVSNSQLQEKAQPMLSTHEVSMNKMFELIEVSIIYQLLKDKTLAYQLSGEQQ
ncbi:hypothetical protein CJF42_12325 [Pseudoalteromonas sp. NBT06-2]|uniref:hypothetical protein n=1 Tax=Pseudoalteromonas sp. NBT06-2 TaxID=2025950 RepID=UPI000BA753CE|nr:hypothetical protein [Pseudoalteromonas sp. NBT06-2]PAJ74092.1 hypothetical protein CJF42_12325 [Pseudoalteromonas sp. NBT06-2]